LRHLRNNVKRWRSWKKALRRKVKSPLFKRELFHLIWVTCNSLSPIGKRPMCMVIPFKPSQVRSEDSSATDSSFPTATNYEL
jgi:hypothetical protein